METNKQGAATIANPQSKRSAKIRREKDISKVLDYFRYKVGTSLDCALGTGILRNSITWYIKDLIDDNMLFVVKRDKDKTTHYPANHYSARKEVHNEK
jgi:hypothetical protein